MGCSLVNPIKVKQASSHHASLKTRQQVLELIFKNHIDINTENMIMARLNFKDQESQVVKIEGLPLCFWHRIDKYEYLFEIIPKSINELGGVTFVNYKEINKERYE